MRRTGNGTMRDAEPGYLVGLYGSGSHAVPEGSMIDFVAKKVA